MPFSNPISRPTEANIATPPLSPGKNPSQAIDFDPPSVALLCDRLHQWCGVHLEASKSYLITNRLKFVLPDFGVGDLGTLIRMADSSTGVRVKDRIIDALTTHETLFFRDQSPFDALGRQVVDAIRKNAGGKRPTLRIWSAACSSGQEPYSIAIKLLESVPDLGEWNISILATDVAAETVKRAKLGRFQEHEIRRGLTPALTQKYFRSIDGQYDVCDKVKQMVRFEVGNLSSPNLPPGPFDLIYCRNVLIYFRQEDAVSVLRKLSERLTPDGYLFVGCSEVLRGVSDFLMPQTIGQATCYRRSSPNKA